MQDRPIDQSFKIDPLQQYIEDSQKIREGTGERFLRGTISSALKAPTLIDETNNYIFNRKEDENASMRSVMDTIKPSSAISFGEKSNDFISDFVGQSISFLPMGLLNVGGAAAEAMSPFIGSSIRAISPSLAHFGETIVPKLGLKGISETTVDELGTSALKHAGQFAGFSATEALEESYNYETNKFNLGKAAIQIGANGAIGAFVPAAQFLLGILGRRVGRLFEKSEVKTERIEPTFENKKPEEETIKTENAPKQTFQEQEITHWAEKAYRDGKMTKRQRDWVIKEEEAPGTPESQQEAAKILTEMGHKADQTTGKVKIDLANENDTHNATNGAHDAIASEAESPHAISNFTYHNSLDRLRLNPEIADGIDGYTAYIDHSLSLEGQKIPELESEIFQKEKSINASIEISNPKKNITDISLKSGNGRIRLETYENQGYMKVVSSGIEGEERGKGFGVALYKKAIDYAVNNDMKFVSDTMISKDAERVYKSLERKGYIFKNRYDDFQRGVVKELVYVPVNKNNIDSLIKSIHEKLTKDGKIVKNYKNKDAYHELDNLSHSWPQARKLLDRINLEDAHNAQRAYSEVLKNYSAMIKAPLGQVAKPETVSDYLKQKLEQQFKKPEITEVIEPTKNPTMSRKNESNEKTNVEESTRSENGEGKTNEKENESDNTEAEDDKYIEKTKGNETRKQYENIRKQYNQWKGASKILDNLISCVMGTTNGEI